MLHIISVFCTVGNIVIFYWQKCSLFPFFVFGYYKQYSVKICRGPAPADPGSSKERRLGGLFKC